MKRITIFCDGTWNRLDAEHPTNVVRLARAVGKTDPSGISQQIHYVMGVGTGRGSSGLTRSIDRLAGGAFGWGLSENIEDAYRALVFNYEPGDEIYIFGFSRGAYTARSLAGFIRSSGIATRETVKDLSKAMERYRTRDRASTKPSDPKSWEFRMQFAPGTATDEAEFNYREQVAPGKAILLKIAYLGVWDTVGALGIPGFLTIAPMVNQRYQFHDTELSRMVASARHAVAIDETRKTFPPALWSNLATLNRRALNLAEDTPLNAVPREDLPYREEWFPGDHGSVGGGNAERGLANLTMAWIAEGAAKQGLAFVPSRLAEVVQAGNPLAPLRGPGQTGLAASITGMATAPREGPGDVARVSKAAADRVSLDGSYRPKPLARVLSALQAAALSRLNPAPAPAPQRDPVP